MNWISMVWLSGLIAPALAKDDLDSVKVDPVHHKVVLENDQVRVVRWVVPTGDKTLNHSHPNSLNINLTDYNGRVALPGSQPFEVHDEVGTLSWRQAGIHVVENIGSQPMVGLIVEPKKPASARPVGSSDPVVADPKHHRVEFENEQIRVIREHYRPGEHIVMHGHPDNVQILLTDMKAELTSRGGKATTIAGKAGEVSWRPATQHSGRILEEGLDQIVIEMKGTQTAGMSV